MTEPTPDAPSEGDAASAPAAAAGTPRTLVGISFGDTVRAQEFLTATVRLASQQRLKLVDAVFVSKDDNGRTTVRETTDHLPASIAAVLHARLRRQVVLRDPEVDVAEEVHALRHDADDGRG